VRDGTQGARLRRSPAGAAILTVVLLGVAIWLVTGSRLFAIREVVVTGTEQLSVGEVERLADVVLGQNLLRVSTDDVAARLGTIPWVARARVSRSFPSTLEIDVMERRPVGWLADPEGRVIVAADGLVLERDMGKPPGLPTLGESSVALEAGDRTTLGAPLRVAASLDAKALDLIAEVGTKEGDVVLDLRIGGQVRYGAPVELGAKRRVLASLLAWTEARQIDAPAIDLRIPSAPALTPQRSGGASA
jgi:cell division protein FtsQ